MATMEQLERALRNAHKAGDTAAATRLAQALKAARSPSQSNADAKGDRVQPDMASDVLSSLGSGVRGGFEALVGTVGDSQQLGNMLAEYLMQKAGSSPEAIEKVKAVLPYLSVLPNAPTTEDAKAVTTDLMGQAYQPQSTAGEYAQTVGAFLPGAVAGPGGVARNVGMATASGLASEAAGQMAEGTQAEPYARLAGALAGGYAVAPKATSVIAKTAREAPSAKEVKQQADDVYNLLRNSGVAYDAGEFGRMAGQLGNLLTREGIMRIDAPKTWARVDDILASAQAGRSPSFDKINSMRSALGELAATELGREKGAAAKVFGVLSDFEKSAPATNTAGLSNADLTVLRAKARDFASRNIKQRELDQMGKDAETYLSGIESGLRNRSASVLRSKKGKRTFNDIERDAVMTVAGGSPTRNILATVGRAGFDVSRMGNVAAALPTAAGAGTAYATGDPVLGASIMALGTGAKYGARKLALRDLERAKGIVRAGKDQQQSMQQKIDAQARKRLAAMGIMERLALSQSPRGPLEITVTGDYAASR